MSDDDGVIQELQQFQLGDLPDGSIALLLAYATTPEKLARREMETFVIGMSRETAARLGSELIAKAGRPPEAPPTRQTEH